MEKVIKVEGMTCDHCVKAVKGALLEQESVNTVDVNLEDGLVGVEFDDDITLDQIKGIIEEQGYDAVK
ncbi:copper ion binding protein [Abyssicoccus albus]|uniref:Copper chaperone n=1 Tax=Abyssicoccus albus TaxID=1817405 RepID=A0A3N5BIY0_9BACL|nr:copper ion binding protein [Abyssicoccus albus]RPF57543.1 copper chaperone [Abyssicoccus albus]